MNGVNEVKTQTAAIPPKVVESSDLQIEARECRLMLTNHRRAMAEAKQDHDETLEAIVEARKNLVSLQNKQMRSDFEIMVEQEHVLMNRVQALDMQLLARQK